MALKAIITSLDGVDESTRKHYVKGDDDRYYLEVESVDGHALEDVAGLKAVLADVKRDRDELSRQAKAFKGLDPVKAREALKRIEEIGDDPQGTIKVQVESQVAQIRDKLQARIGELEKSLSDREGVIHQLVIEDAAIHALSKHKLIDGGSELLLPHVMSQLTVKETETGKSMALVSDGKGGYRLSMRKGTVEEPMDADELVEMMASQPLYKSVFAGTGLNGTNSHDRRPGSITNTGNLSRSDVAESPTNRLQRGFIANRSKTL